MMMIALLAMQGGSIHELQLDMRKKQVEEVLGSLGAPDPEWPVGAEVKYDVPGGNLFFCGNRLTTIIIDLTGEVQSFSRAVDNETKARGDPAIKFEHVAWGSVEAKWRMAPYQYLTISMLQYRTGQPVRVQRVLSRLERCKDGVLK